MKLLNLILVCLMLGSCDESSKSEIVPGVSVAGVKLGDKMESFSNPEMVVMSNASRKVFCVVAYGRNFKIENTDIGVGNSKVDFDREFGVGELNIDLTRKIGGDGDIYQYKDFFVVFDEHNNAKLIGIAGKK